MNSQSEKQSDGTLKQLQAPVVIDLDHSADSVEAFFEAVSDGIALSTS